MHFSCRPFIGKINSRFWSQYWENEPDNISLVSQKGHLFGLVSILSEDDDSDLNIIGRSVIEDFTTNYYANPGTISESITTSAKDIKLPEERSLELSLQICVVNFPKVYLFNVADNKVFILRDTQFSTLINGSSSQVLSGTLQLEDKLFLVSQKFTDSITQENLIKNLSGSVNEIEENFSSHLFSLPNQNGFSALFIQVQPDEEVVESVAPVMTPVMAPVAKPQFIEHSDTHESVFRKKISLIISLLLILLLSVSVVFGFRRNQAVKLETNYQNLKKSLEQKINDSSTVKSLNIESSLKAAEEAKGIYDQIVALKTHQNELQPFSDQITQLLTLTGSSTSFPGTEIYDTSNIIKTPQYISLFLSKTKLTLLDNQAGRIDEVDIAQKSFRNIATSENLKNTTKLIVDQNKYYSLGSNSLTQANSSKTIVFDNLTVKDISVWNGNFYLLTVDNIYKMSQNPDAFTSPKVWLKEGQSLPSSPSSIAINGRIWVMSSTGVISPYNLGLKENFKPSSTLQFSQAHHLVTSISKDVLVFVDGDFMIYVYNKDGTSLAKFNFGNKKIIDIAYDEDLNRIYALCADQKIYSIGL